MNPSELESLLRKILDEFYSSPSGDREVEVMVDGECVTGRVFPVLNDLLELADVLLNNSPEEEEEGGE